MNIVVSLLSQVPIYEQIQSQIKELILTGKLKPGEQLPSIRLLAKDLKVSVITVKRAYEELEREGIIATLHGRGCFITDVNIDKIREINMNTIRERLDEIISFSDSCGIGKDEIKSIINEIYDGRNK